MAQRLLVFGLSGRPPLEPPIDNLPFRKVLDANHGLNLCIRPCG